MKRPTFNIGDLVEFKVPAPKNTPEAQHAYGQIVPYRGNHDPEDPRVRWNSGWAFNVRAVELAHVTAEAAKALPPIKLAHIDKQ
jgi:hypothetical protein